MQRLKERRGQEERGKERGSENKELKNAAGDRPS